MAREIKAAFEEVVSRLEAANNATGTGDYGLLEGVTLIEGPTEQTFEDADLPIVIYEILSGGAAEDSHFPDRMRGKMTILLTVMTHVDNGYYNANKTGIIDFYEKIMTVIDGASITDITGNGHWGPMPPQYEIGGFERDGLRYVYLIEVEIQTARYGKGDLQ